MKLARRPKKSDSRAQKCIIRQKCKKKTRCLGDCWAPTSSLRHLAYQLLIHLYRRDFIHSVNIIVGAMKALLYARLNQNIAVM